jgi:hypothetical protein
MTAPALPRRNTNANSNANAASGGLLATRLSAEQATLRARSTAAAVLATIATVAVVAAVGALALGDGRWMSWPRLVPAVVWLAAA